MLFNSFEFFWFFPLVVMLYFVIPARWRWLLLLIASYYFYMCWRVEYALLLVISTLVDFTVSHRMALSTSRSAKKRWLLVSIVTNLGILFSFKYFNFLNSSVAGVAKSLDMHYTFSGLDVLLPMGISFYTFQTMAYTIDVYRGTVQPARHFGKFALYVTFFPQLVAGPIERAQSLLPQFDRTVKFDRARIQQGLKQMLWGFFKKLVVADRVALVVDQVYSNPGQNDALVLALATYLFALQIYCDFSGYSDIAIGAARILGFNLMENFRVPYSAGSIREFWSRWHISLSTWFRDYLYIPLGGNRVVKWRWYYNLFLVFLISGLWHGANWTFVVWGALHGAYLVIALLIAPLWLRLRDKASFAGTRLWKWFNVILTFQLAVFAWIFFRANTVQDAFTVVWRIFTWTADGSDIMSVLQDVGPGVMAVTLLFALLFVVIDPMLDKVVKQERIPSRSMSFLIFATVLACTLTFGHFGESQFIYFQF
jgi:D-alanyl-lipoteichoic acid acyltransferase DltB (MBOAT superfamily)